MAEYEEGGMDISEQERTFEGFVRWTMRSVIAIVLALVILGFLNA